MSLLIFSSLILSTVLSMPFIVSPLTMGFAVILTACITAVLMGTFISSWYAYALFLIYVGGLLIMFMYVSTLIPNTFFFSMSNMPVIVFIVLTSYMFISSFWYKETISTTTDSAMLNQSWELTEYPVFLTTSGSHSIMILLAIILLINLLSIVKICYNHKGPLRPHY
uniref:NADH dehydrogenase subunit 6 n=1 Tax=Paralepetopsis sp. TaxID=3071116 RepID=A0AA96HSC3_9GAST|nr:NADH dehydrogenase subunit 6 [Paralepetopsis sp.]